MPEPFTVIGVMPESFLGSTFYLHHSFWVPVMMAQKFGRRAEWQTDRSDALFRLYGRLKPGLTMVQAEMDLNSVAGVGVMMAEENLSIAYWGRVWRRAWLRRLACWRWCWRRWGYTA